MQTIHPNNEQLYLLMHQIADLLDLQGADVFRINAFRHAADQIASMPQDLVEMVKRQDLESLIELPAIGRRIAGVLSEFVHEGQSRYLNRLRGDVLFDEVLKQIPGIGPALAKRITRYLQIGSIEDLEQATYDGRLLNLPGFGKARIKLLQIAIEDMLGKRRITSGAGATNIPPRNEWPAVELLLALDAEYRQLSRENRLKKIAPRRFNPTQDAWLPIYHTERESWSFTILYSNTALAHQLNKHREWVIVYYHNEYFEGQATVVTETRGIWQGKRMVRGREKECGDYYDHKKKATSSIT